MSGSVTDADVAAVREFVREFAQSPYGWPKWMRVEKQDAALAALDRLAARLQEVERDRDYWRSFEIEWRARVELAEARLREAERERDDWEQRYEDLLGEVGGVWPG